MAPYAFDVPKYRLLRSIIRMSAIKRSESTGNTKAKRIRRHRDRQRLRMFILEMEGR